MAFYVQVMRDSSTNIEEANRDGHELPLKINDLSQAKPNVLSHSGFKPRRCGDLYTTWPPMPRKSSQSANLLTSTLNKRKISET